MGYDILTAGVPMVEIMRKERGVSFREPADFTGPYPSGDTCIVLDVAARLGKKCCLLGVSGDDVFGDIVLDRLAKDGVDVSSVRRTKEYPTAVVFVRYDRDGKREYLDLVLNSACSQMTPDDIVEEKIKAAKWIHFSGEVLGICMSGERRKAVLKLLELIPADSKVSLDPNFTGTPSDAAEALEPFIERADLILPSENEARVMMNTPSDEEACEKLASCGKIVALKRGKNGCEIFYGSERERIPPFQVREVDPTGCGDSFCAGFICGLLDGKPVRDAARFANAAGALQAAGFGPMEGIRDLDRLERFMR